MGPWRRTSSVKHSSPALRPGDRVLPGRLSQHGAEDVGVHTVCTRVTAEFLAFSASVGNDLSTPHPSSVSPASGRATSGASAASRWQEAFEAGMAPPVVLASTHAASLEWVQLSDLVTHAI